MIINIADVLLARAGLKGVQSALLDRPARQELRRELATLLPTSAMLGPCRLRRAKFKPGRKLTANYDVSIYNRVTGASCIRPIAVSWTLQASATAAGVQAEMLLMQAEARRRGLSTPFTQLMADVPADGMRIQVSPLDASFPQLVRVSDPQYVRDVLAAVYARPARAPTSQYAITPIRYRPGQRHVLRYDSLAATGKPNSRGTLFAKLYHGETSSQAFFLATQIADWLSARGLGVTAVRPIAHLATDAIILYPRIVGAPLSRQLGCPAHRLDGWLQQIGAALRVLHCAPAELRSNLVLHDFATEVAAIARASEHVHALLPVAGTAIIAILDRARDLYERLPHEVPTFVHGDFKAYHLWVTRAGLSLMDFDTCCLADPALDIGKFLADLHWWYAIGDQPGLEWAQERFLTGYAPGTPSERLLRARLYEVLVLVKITVHRVPLFAPDWALRTERLIHRAEKRLHALASTMAITA